MTDLEEPVHTCEMCGQQDIRYVHTMENSLFDGSLDVGCVCAARMEDDPVAPRAREAELRGRAGRRERWLQRQWRRSRQGGWYLRADGRVFTITPNLPGWSASVRLQHGGWQFVGRYVTPDMAKLAAFDAVWPATIRLSASKPANDVRTVPANDIWSRPRR